MNLRRDAYVFVRATGVDIIVGGQVAVSGHPSVPSTWDLASVDGGWVRAITPGGVVLHMLRMNTSQIDPADGVWLVVQREPGGTAKLAALAAAGSNTAAGSMLDAWLAARAGNATARAVLRHWPDWKVSGFESDGVGGSVAFTGVRRVLARDSGNRIPASVLSGVGGPWHFDSQGDEVAHIDSTEALHVTAFHRPGLLQTMAGYDDVTPDAGTPED